MQAVQFPAARQIHVTTVADPVPAADEVVVTVRAAALNHRDLWIKLGQYAGLKYPCIPGSDGAGVVAADSADGTFKAGDEVIIYPGYDWGDNPRAQASTFSILGLPRDGTLAQKIAVPTKQLAPKPVHLTWTEAAALPLAGLTAYRALFARSHLRTGEKVLITGIGGGVALFALQFAVADGAEVWVTSSSEAKIAQAVALGAKSGFNYTTDGWAEAAATEIGGADVIVDSAGGAGFASLVDIAKPGGRIVFFGATRGDPDVLPARKVFWKQLSILGTTMGNADDWAAMLAFTAEHQIKPVVSDTFAVADAPAAFDLMEQGGQFGKIVVTM
ncbi:zinc-binding dehydrogenase [Synoicihabitans lomoniglobus]|nr:zinc-binding dehydrogenase [Opitutaceae bacterium LMO-M01]